MTLRFRKLWLACGAGFVALVVYLSLTPDPLSTPTFESVKTGHVLAYFWLMFWFSQLYRPARARAGIAASLLLLGVGLEYAQALTGYRTFAYGDMADDAIGICIGLVLGSGPGGRALAALEGFAARRARFSGAGIRNEAVDGRGDLE